MSKFSDCFVCTATYWLYIYLLPYSISHPNQLPNKKPKNNKPNNTIKLTTNCSKERISHSYYLMPFKPSFQHLSIRPLEQTVKFVCSSLNVTNPKNPKAFKMHPQPNKLFQIYLNQLIFRLQVLSTLFKISHYHSTSAWVKFISILLDNTISFYYFAPLSPCSARKNILNYIFITKYYINVKLPNTQPIEYPT